MINLKECESILFIVNFLACVINDNQIFYQSILSTYTCYFLPHEHMLDYKKVKTNVSFVLYVWGFFGFEIAMSVFFFLSMQ